MKGALGRRTLLACSVAFGAGCGGSAAPPPPPCLADSVAAGATHTCVLKSDGSWWCWGGLAQEPIAEISGDLEPFAATREGVVPPGIKRIAMRSDMVCGLSDTGGVACPPDAPLLSPVAELAMGLTTDDLPYTNPMTGAVAFPDAENCVVKTDQTLWCFNTTDAQAVEQVTAFGPGVVQAASGFGDLCAVEADGSAWCWTDVCFTSGCTLPPPVAEPAPRPVVSVATGFGYACLLLDDGTVWCWGAGATNEPPLAPAPVYIGDVQSLVMGYAHACALRHDGSVWCWGDATVGALGGSSGFYVDPIEMTGLGHGVVEIAAGQYHTCALKSDRTVWCWGNGVWGQIGNNRAANPPTQMLGCE